jgi:hypothetical protein
MGMLMARYVVRVPAIAAAPREDLVRTVGPVVQGHLTGSLEPSERRRATRST